MKTFSEQTRQRMSDSAKKRCTPEWRKRKSLMYETKLDTEKIKDMYERGMTQTEIAEELGVSQKVIWRHMHNHGITARKAAKRDQSGVLNHMWKGNKASYKAFHFRLKTVRGKASDYGCAVCGTKDPSLSYDWANLTGNYDDINDFLPMCRSCHRQYDKKRKETGKALEVIGCQY